MTLAEKRAAVIGHHKLLESIPETAWSPLNPAMRARLDNGELPLSERPVAFLDDDRVLVAGGCAERVLAALRAFADSAAPKSPQEAHAAAVAARANWTDDPARGRVLAFGSRDWNGALFALAARGIQVCVTDAPALEPGA